MENNCKNDNTPCNSILFKWLPITSAATLKHINLQTLMKKCRIEKKILKSFIWLNWVLGLQPACLTTWLWHLSNGISRFLLWRRMLAIQFLRNVGLNCSGMTEFYPGIVVLMGWELMYLYSIFHLLFPRIELKIFILKLPQNKFLSKITFSQYFHRCCQFFNFCKKIKFRYCWKSLEDGQVPKRFSPQSKSFNINFS